MSFTRRHKNTSRLEGFSLIEMVIAVAIILVLALLAIPLIQNISGYFIIQGAGSNVTSAIQSSRYQAIFQGCPYQIAFTAASNSYQIQGEPYSAATNTCAAAFTNICPAGATTCAVPLSGGARTVTIPADATLTFFPGGRVQSAGGACPCTLVLTYSNRTATITVSNYGNVNIQYAP